MAFKDPLRRLKLHLRELLRQKDPVKSRQWASDDLLYKRFSTLESRPNGYGIISKMRMILSGAFEQSSKRPTPMSPNYQLQTKTSYTRASNIDSSLRWYEHSRRTWHWSIPWFPPGKAHAKGEGGPNAMDIGLVESKWKRIPLHGASSTRLPCNTFVGSGHWTFV